MKTGKVYVAKVTLNEVFNIRVFQTSTSPAKYACLDDVVRVIGEDVGTLEFFFTDRETNRLYFPEKTFGSYRVIPLGTVIAYWAQMADHYNQFKDEGNNVALQLTRSLFEKGLEDRADEVLRTVRSRDLFDLYKTHQLTA
ncbi:hypothetical protein [Coleofasciculus sp. FACHB-SPT36]|uniref:hypothetical protein n=1 Tax=Cyanophyceae TaxID=3028117 RepID=UPI00168A8F47|nr:hypothetical protein [Coleofasciculus sp. FACHB-SPT36]MBD2537519.1 hypothetical protein [Coleofasciculus sp. FACHB-SPT36]